MEISFENNLGRIEFENCMLEISDQYQWSGSAAKHSKQISINGYVFHGADQGFGSLQSGPVSAGQTGTLILPWTTLTGVRINDVSWPEGHWQSYSPVRVDFSDDMPARTAYLWHFFGLRLHNPRLETPVPFRQSRNQTVQMPYEPPGGIFDMSESALWKTIRSIETHDAMTFNLTGTVFLSEVQIPNVTGPSTKQLINHVIETLQQRAGSSDITQDQSTPAGYPRVFHLDQAIPEMGGEIEVAHCFVRKARANWSVEQESIRVDITLQAPPQKVY